MRHALSFWSDPWRPAQDWYSLSPSADLFDQEEHSHAHLPACDIDEKSDHFLITLDVPGVSKEDIRIELENGKLVVRAERKHEREGKQNNVFISERRYGKFERAFDLGEHVDADKIDAQYQDGVLKIALGKAEQAKPRSIAVKSGEKGSLFESLSGSTKKEVN